MSTSGTDATRASLISSPHESKRGACDRCRGQKLRCLREDQSQDSTCVRCFKAGAICSFGTPKRAGRPRGSSSYPSQERRGNGGANPKHGGKPSRPTANTSEHGILFDGKVDKGLHRNSSGMWDNGCFLRENTAEEESGGETEDTIPVHAMSPSSLFDNSNILGDFPAAAGSSTAALPWPDETFPPFYSDHSGEASGLEPFGPKYSWAFQHYPAGPMDMQMLTGSPLSTDGQTRDVGVNAYATAAPSHSGNVQSSQPPDEAMDIDLPSALIQPVKIPTARQSGARDRAKDRARLPTSFNGNATAQPSLPKESTGSESGSAVNDDNLSGKEGQHRRMQELSELAMKLYAQLAANDPETHSPASTAPTPGFQDQLVGSVLKSSTTFLTLLTSFATHATASSGSPSHAANSSRSPSASPPTSAPSGDDSSPIDPAPPPPSDSASLPPTDMTTVLQLLTCYIRIVHLHGIMYARILEYTQAHAAATALPPVFPGLAVGGEPLDAFGTLQVVLLLQIAVHVLGEIEAALGLPEEYRVGRRRGGGRGVLGASVSGGFVRCLMREGVWRGKRVEAIREQLGQLKRVLEGAVGF
ncbi:hypothetical protein MMC27_005955 [Xylographa pallens]|nr:hypothetical protein [Xylographa pallens]